MDIQLIRHATMVLNYGGKRLLVDPMLSPQGTMEPVVNSPNPRSNPLVELPVNPEELLHVDAVLLTHTHRDHFDDTAAALIPKDKLIICPPEDQQKLKTMGFVNVKVIDQQGQWEGIKIIRFGGCHGTGDIGLKMGPVSGYLLEAPTEPKLYLAGDTIWCQEVEKALEQQPEIVILYAGAAQFLTGGPITMTAEDIIQVCRSNNKMKVVVVHMEAFNHCLLTRSDLRGKLAQLNLLDLAIIPEDGEIINF